jgi:uncharacterized protein (DUF427 family)
MSEQFRLVGENRMKIPDETHPITLERERAHLQVLFEGHEIADSRDVVVLTEAGYPPVRYFPREDVRMIFLRRTDKVTHCPYKGDASYYTIYRDRQIIENAAWSYEDPFAAVGGIGGRIAFYPEHVEFQVGALSAADTEALDSEAGGVERLRGTPAGVDAAGVDEVVRHTDSGSGSSQAEHWPPTVDTPDADDGLERPAVDQPYRGTGSI